MSEREKQMVSLGRERYRKKVSDARQHGVETFTVAGRYLLKESVARLQDALDEWMLRATLISGRAHSVHPLLEQLPTGTTALITMKVVLDQIARERVYMTTALSIANMLEDEARMRAYHKAMPPQARRLMKTYFETGYKQLRKRVKLAMEEAQVDFKAWPRRLKARLGSMLLEMVRLETGLIDVVMRPTAVGKSQLLVLPDDVSLAWLEEAHEKHEILFPFYLPLTTPPADWEGLYDGGYHSDVLLKRPLVKVHDQEALIDLGQAEMPEVYDAVNALQRVGWRVNTEVLGVLKALWESGSEWAGLPRRDDERPPPSPEDYKTNEEAAKTWRKTARLVHDRNRTYASHRLMVSKILFMAEQFKDETFYYPQQLDFRGRLYPIPFFLQPQGPSLARGLLQFAQGGLVNTPEAMGWWKIHGANCFGLDKQRFHDRKRWVDDNWGQIVACAEDPFSYTLWLDADKPWEFLAFCFEARRFDQGNYMSFIPVQMDGSNNGLQIFSLLLRDEVGGRATNCVPTERPQDIYQEVADKATEAIRKRADAGEPFALAWLQVAPAGLPRSAVKRQVMTLPYGATAYSCHQYTMDWYLEARNATDVNPFPKDYFTPCWWLSRRIWDAIGEVVVAARDAMAWLQKCADVLARQGQPVKWVTPVGFPVRQAYTDYSTERIKTSYGESVRQVNLRARGTRLSKRQQRQGISPNYVHSLDAAALVRTITLSVERGIDNFMMVHDSFGTTAAQAPLLAECLRRAYVEIFSEDLLDDFREQIIAQGADPAALPELPTKGTLDVGELTSSLYFFA